MLESGGMQRTFQRIGTNSRAWKVTLAYVIIQQALCHDKCLRLTSIDEALNLRLKELPNKFVSSKTAMKHSSTEQFPQIIYWVEKLVPPNYSPSYQILVASTSRQPPKQQALGGKGIINWIVLYHVIALKINSSVEKTSHSEDRTGWL